MWELESLHRPFPVAGGCIQWMKSKSIHLPRTFGMSISASYGMTRGKGGDCLRGFGLVDNLHHENSQCKPGAREMARALHVRFQLRVSIFSFRRRPPGGNFSLAGRRRECWV